MKKLKLLLPFINVREIALLIAAIMIPACSMEDDDVSSVEFNNRDALESCYVPADRMSLFADFSGYSLNAETTLETKSASQTSYPLSELLDFDKTEEKVINETRFRQTPFKQNRDSILASIHSSPEITIDSCGFIRKYLIEAIDKNNKRYIYVVTMIPESESETVYDFFYKANYSGLAIYSKLDGGVVYCKRYVLGEIFWALPVDGSAQDGRMEYLSLVKVFSTKDGSYTITPSICIDLAYNWIDGSYCYGYPGSGGGQNGNDDSTPGSGGSSLNQPTLNENISDDDQLLPQEEEFLVEVVANTKDILFSCNGRYFTKGSSLCVVPEPQWEGVPYKDDAWEHQFSFWAGDFDEQTKDSFIIDDIEQSYRSIAYYDTEKPCVDKNTGKGNPMSNMSIAASSSWNYKGGTFGYTRSDGVKARFHAGIDIAATPGTPVFSMFDGVITYIADSYPDDYRRNSYGNEIRIKSTFEGETIIMQYSHLLFGNPVAEDPFSGSTLSVGSNVYQGQLIGYSGNTGNAFYVSNKHLHLGCKVNGSSWVDPARFINGDIDAENQNTTKKGKIDKIKCN